MSLRSALVLAMVPIAELLSAQCGTVAPMGPQPVQAPVLTSRGGGPQFILPIVFHVYYTDLPQLTPPWTIQYLVDQTNLALRAQNSDLQDVCSTFAPLIGDLSVELRLAGLDPNGNCTTGIVYHYYTGGAPDMNGATWDPARYLNIHLYGMSAFSSATLPQPGGDPNDPLDCIYLMQTHANNPRVLTHEVGHWLGLYHTFGNSNNSGVACGDDGVLDTPVTMGSPVGNCDTTLAACTPGVIENVNNIMDYSGCRYMFTQGQAERVAAILTDANYPRWMHCTPANLASTGVEQNVPCPLSVDFHYHVEPACDQAVVTIVPLVTGQVVDQFTWTHPGASIAPNTQNSPVLTYTAAGIHMVKLVACNGAVCDSSEQVVQITLNDANSNGLQAASLPFTQTFQDGFSFPDPHVASVDNGGQQWLVNSTVGYASDRCLYVPPAAPPYVNETIDVRIGNFDLSALVQPAIRFKLATTYYDTVRFANVQVLLRDLCDNSLPVGPWANWNTYEVSGSQSPGFFPGSSDQWVVLGQSTAPWALYHHAEFTIRVTKAVLPSPPFDDEPIYIDDINIGEYSLITATTEASHEERLLVMPNPASADVRIEGRAGDRLQVVDITGRMVLTRTLPADMHILEVSQWPRGAYLVSVQRDGRMLRERLVLE